MLTQIYPMSGTSRRADPELVALAEQASFHAYAPYSRFYVGAAVRTASGDVYTGANFENGSYGATICAERAAIGNALAAENHRGRGIKIVRIAVFARSGKKKQPKTVSPCGICRQVIFEFGPDAVVDFLENRRFTSKSMHELLPAPFELA
jgi:cytidine deaminase